MCDGRELRRLQEENAFLKERLLILEEKINALEKLLGKYENPHVPPSMRRRKRPPKGKSHGKPGQKAGHTGMTRAQPVPDEHIESKLEQCPRCNIPLGEPMRTERRVIEDIPEPMPVRTIEYHIHHYWCDSCEEEIVASHPDVPEEGRFGKNVQAQAVLMKYEERLPVRKIRDTLERQYGLKLSTASIYDFTRRVSDKLQSEYLFILRKIRNSEVVYADETGIHVDGEKYWIWIFVTQSDTFVVIRKSRGMKVLKETLTEDYSGIIVCDGWKPYSGFTKRIQRCWAHLLREAKHMAEKVEEAIPLSKAIHRLYHKLTRAINEDPPPEVRKRLWYHARATLNRWLGKDYEHPTIGKLITKIRNGFDHWFTFILHPGVEPTNNRAERALREHVVQRKIIGTLRNTKGTHIHEVTMSVLATWKQQDKNLCQALKAAI